MTSIKPVDTTSTSFFAALAAVFDVSSTGEVDLAYITGSARSTRSVARFRRPNDSLLGTHTHRELELDFKRDVLDRRWRTVKYEVIACTTLLKL